MEITNYDNCSYMEDCRLICYADVEDGQRLWDENYKQHKGNTYFFHDFGENIPTCRQDMYDFSKCTRQDYRYYCLSYASVSLQSEEIIAHKTQYYDTWEEFALDTLNEMELTDKTSSIHGSRPLYTTVVIHGYSQGNTMCILYKTSEYTHEDAMKKMFTDAAYGTPYFCHLIVNGDEFYLSDGLDDLYSWDRDHVLQYAHGLQLSHKVITWLEVNLPDHVE